jgi:FKBP-type peptidyl-prolyl cis-trans isomerase SlyD
MKTFLKLIVLAALMTGTQAMALIGDDAKPIADGMKVTMDYKLSVPEKQMTLTTENKDPVSYIQGSGQMNPVLESALYGLKPGDSKHVILTPDQGFGPHDDTKLITVPKENLPPEIQEGSMLHDPMGQVVTVAAIEDDSVVLDLNHPLAGQNLIFDIHILNVETPNSQ